MPAFSHEQRIHRSPDAIAKELDGEFVLLDLQSGTYFGLNEVGSRIWALMEEPVAVGDIRARLLDEFDVPEATLDQDMEVFLGELEGRRLLVRA